MLVLSRRKGESIVINHDIFVTVVEIRDDKVRLGVTHPREVPVHRQEVYEAIRREDSRRPQFAAVMGTEQAMTEEAPPLADPAPLAEPQPETAAAKGSLLDRVVDALRAKLPAPVGRELVVQAIAEAAVQELSAEVVQSASGEELKALLLAALQGKG